MKTLFDNAANAEIISRIEKLTPSSERQWGKMKVEQMLAHLALSFRVNFGEILLDKNIILSTFFRGVARNMLLGEKPYRKNLPTDKKVLPKGPVDFVEEKQKVMEMIKMYTALGPGIISKNPHNILGKITPEQSAFISYKHVDHHLRQFGV